MFASLERYFSSPLFLSTYICVYVLNIAYNIGSEVLNNGGKCRKDRAFSHTIHSATNIRLKQLCFLIVKVSILSLIERMRPDQMSIQLCIYLLSFDWLMRFSKGFPLTRYLFHDQVQLYCTWVRSYKFKYKIRSSYTF